MLNDGAKYSFLKFDKLVQVLTKLLDTKNIFFYLLS